MVGVLVLALWLLLAAIDQVVLNKVMKDSPELQEVVNSVLVAYTINLLDGYINDSTSTNKIQFKTIAELKTC